MLDFGLRCNSGKQDYMERDILSCVCPLKTRCEVSREAKVFVEKQTVLMLLAECWLPLQPTGYIFTDALSLISWLPQAVRYYKYPCFKYRKNTFNWVGTFGDPPDLTQSQLTHWPTIRRSIDPPLSILIIMKYM